ncbi:MAG: FAD-dependent oxidoreductase [Promethearchaeota archaeon]
MEKIKIGILGGGLSGLTAAYLLNKKLQDKIKLTIIEKESELGGRILTKKFLGCPIELGAQFFVDGGEVHSLVKSLNLERDVISLENNFISFYYNNSIFDISELINCQDNKLEWIREKEKLLDFARKVNFEQKLISFSFEEWYRKKIGDKMLQFLNRMLISIGVRDIKSINAYFGLILINVFFGKNYLLKSGLKTLINNLIKQINSSDCSILLNSECTKIEGLENNFKLTIKKEGSSNILNFDKLIVAIKPNEILKIMSFDKINTLKKIDEHPMKLYVIESSKQLWQKTWGLIIVQEDFTIYALCDWKNITKANEKTPILLICSPDAETNEVLSNLKYLSPDEDSKFKIIDEKKWEIGLHQANEDFFKIPKFIKNYLPKGVYLAGDWTVLPALEGAVISAQKSIKQLINDIETED